MSLLWTLKRFIDPKHATEEEARRRQLELTVPDKDEGEGEVSIQVIEPPERTYQCRICRHRGPQSEFCPHCLAGTMQPV